MRFRQLAAYFALLNNRKFYSISVLYSIAYILYHIIIICSYYRSIKVRYLYSLMSICDQILLVELFMYIVLYQAPLLLYTASARICDEIYGAIAGRLQPAVHIDINFRRILFGT